MRRKFGRDVPLLGQNSLQGSCNILIQQALQLKPHVALVRLIVHPLPVPLSFLWVGCEIPTAFSG